MKEKDNSTHKDHKLNKLSTPRPRISNSEIQIFSNKKNIWILASGLNQRRKDRVQSHDFSTTQFQQLLYQQVSFLTLGQQLLDTKFVPNASEFQET